MITYGEIVPNGITLTQSQEDNVRSLLIKMNRIRAEYGNLMRVTSGFRTKADQLRINPADPLSLHTTGCAIDIYDPDPEQFLWNWCIDNLEILTEVGVWVESRLYSKNHVHFQIYPPASGNRIFVP